MRSRASTRARGGTGGLKSENAALVGDCAEMLTQVAEQHPDWVAHYAEALAALLNHRTTRVRWEAMHALSFIAASVPTVIASLLPTLSEKVRTDSSVIVRDYAIDTIANYAATGRSAAESAYPLLKEALAVWNGKHAGHALKGFVNVALQVPALGDELYRIGEEYARSIRGVIRRSAKELLRAMEPRTAC